MIESINIKNVATYNETGIKINNLKKINFIYGTNGCGKTTISNFLYNPMDSKFVGCSVVWKNEQELKTLVYNKEFRKRNFGKGKFGGIFTLGEATAEEINAIEKKGIALKELKEELAKKRETVKGLKGNKTLIETEFQETSWVKVYKKHESHFKEAFIGVISKEKFKNKLLLEFENNKESLNDIDSLKEKAKTIFGKIPQIITHIGNITFDRIIEIENELIWKKTVVGKGDVDIARLIQKLNITDWVNQGRKYLNEEEVCPFCQQNTVTSDFQKQLESFFDETYLNDIKSIKALKLEYSSLIMNIINELNLTEISQKAFSNSKLNIDRFSAYLKTLISQNTANSELLKTKEKEPSRSIDLISLKEQLGLIANLIENANAEIKKHNLIVSNYNAERTSLIKSIWKFIVNEFASEISKFNVDNSGLQKGINALEVKIGAKIVEFKSLDLEIKELSKNVTSIQPTVNEINRLLKSYGFTNFEIVPANEDGFYQIQREDGTIAETTLSEGEITFITFLYYLQLAKGGLSEETVNEERILIVDDPISSLDSNVLFVVSTLIKEIIKEVKTDKGFIRQVILLTHNVYFHKEVSFEGLNRKSDKSHFWILRKVNNVTTVQPYKEQNPIKSSYELLWNEIKEWEKNSGTTIQNTMRRILENYFGILGNKRDDTFIGCFDTQEEREICRSLLSWINEGSHTLPDDLYIESPDETIEKYLKVFKEIFTHTRNEGHYYMMMGINDVIKEDVIPIN